MRPFHPLVHNALDLCFKGSGHPEGLAGVLQSSAWQSYFDYYESLSARVAGTELGYMLNAGPHRVGLEFCRSRGREWSEVVENVRNCQERWQPDPYVLATLDHLGEAIQNAAVQCLPKQFSVPEDEIGDWQRLKLPLSLSELADAWHAGDDETRKDIGWLLVDVFRFAPDKRRLDRGRDILHQKAEFVLPGFFGAWDEQSDYQPNCLGKAALIAALARYAGIDALFVVPAQACFLLKDRLRGELADMSLAGFSQARVPLCRRRTKSLKKIARDGRCSQDEPSWLHACIALRVENHLWMFVDPNGEMIALTSTDWGLGTAYDDLQRIGSVLPGLSFLEQMGDNSFDNNFHEFRQLAKDALDQVVRFAKKGFPADATKSDVVERLSKSSLLDVAVKMLPDDREFELEEPTLNPHAPRRYKAVCLLMEHHYLRRSKNSAQQVDPKLKWRMLKDLDHSIAEGLLLGEMTDSQARRALVALCYTLGTRALNKFTEDYQLQVEEAEVVHSQCQIGGVGYFLATSVLAHVACCMGRSVSLEVEPLLCRHAFDLHRLHVVAGAGVLNWRNKQRRQEALEAASILESLPFVLPSTERILPYLQQMRSLIAC